MKKFLDFGDLLLHLTTKQIEARKQELIARGIDPDAPPETEGEPKPEGIREDNVPS